MLVLYTPVSIVKSSWKPKIFIFQITLLRAVYKHIQIREEKYNAYIQLNVHCTIKKKKSVCAERKCQVSCLL